MAHEGSVTHWINDLKAGDGVEADAQQALWNRYFEQLTRLAKNRLNALRDRVVDEEDVAASAFESFFRGVELNRYPQLNDRTNLWPLLVTITARKALNQKRRAAAKKRGGGRVQGESAFGDAIDDAMGIENIAGPEPTPDFAAEVSEECQRRLDQLNDKQREVAELKLQGFKNVEIAERLGVITETVERRLRRIRELWTNSGSRV